MKIKMIYSDFNPNTGLSTVTIRTPHGDFTGYAKVHEDDIKYQSRFIGCQYAETRAYIKLLKHQRNECKIKLKTLMDLQMNLPKAYQKCKNLNKTIVTYQIDIDNYTFLINQLQQKIQYSDKEITKVRNR